MEWVNENNIIKNCKTLIKAYQDKKLWYMKMPEDTHPNFKSKEENLVYFTLPMALNYQRNSYKLWESCLETHKNNNKIFSIKTWANIKEEDLRKILTQYKIALQPNKHIKTWMTISQTIYENWWSIENLLKYCDWDFLKLQNTIQKDYKKWFPYLSGPKIFHYWSYILGEYCDIKLKNREFIEIAPDTHIKQCSIKLWVIIEKEADKISSEQISSRWREILKWSWISPIDMHSPLWFWSRNNFEFKLKT